MDKKLLEQVEKEFEKVYLGKKKYAFNLAKVYSLAGEEKRANTVRNCSTFFEYGHYSDNSVKFHSANFCKDPLCPVCAKRRSIKIFKEVIDCVEHIQTMGDYSFLFVTLTIKDVQGDKLKETCDFLSDCYVNLLRQKRMSFVKGSFRCLEITHDNNEFITHDMYFGNEKKHMKNKVSHYNKLGLKIGDRNPHFDFYHPHLHCIWIVENSYFKSNQYIKQDELVQIWKNLIFADYKPIVDIRRCTNKNLISVNVDSYQNYEKSLSSAVAEVAKYSVKGCDYLGGSDDLNVKTVKCLLDCFKNRKLFVFTGLFREVRRLLKDLYKTSSEGDILIPSTTSFGTPYLIGKVFFSWCDSQSKYISTYHRVYGDGTMEVRLDVHVEDYVSSDIDLSECIDG